MPLFPTTNQEKTLGYDVDIGGSLFLQFKRPRYLKSKKIYKISIENQEQFRILYNLKQNKPTNKVFYAAPIFHEITEMRKFYLSKTIENNSALFPLELFPFPKDDGHHELSYEYHMPNVNPSSVPLTNLNAQPKGTYGILNSDPISIETLHSVISASDNRDVMPLVKKAEFLIEQVIPRNAAREFEIESPVDRLFAILLVKYNILWIPIL